MRTDHFGDKLPPGGLARFGRTRLWHAPGRAGAESLAFAPDGQSRTSTGQDGSVRIWDVAAGRELRRLDWSEGEAKALAIAPGGRSIAASGLVRTIRHWDLATGREKLREDVHRGGVAQAAFAPDGKTLTLVGHDGAICISDTATGAALARRVLLDVATGRELARLEGHQGYVPALAFSCDGSLLATGGGDTTVSVLDLTPYRAGGR